MLKKILIIYFDNDKVAQIAEGIKDGAEKNGNKAEIMSTAKKGKIVTFHPYDLVIVGAPTLGIFRGKVPSEISRFLKNCKRTAGQEAVAFVTPRFFATTKALRNLMGSLEAQGCIVNDFKNFKSYNEAVTYGENL